MNKEQKSKRNRAYQKKWYEANKEEHKKRTKANKIKHYERNKQRINDLKSYPCTDCGNCFNPVAMDYDHINPSNKKINISKMMNAYSWERIQEEIAKCELVCANCHRVRTHERIKMGVSIG